MSACDESVTDVDDFRLSGTVRLVGYERDATGLQMGSRSVDDATGVRITLTQNGAEFRTTTTTNGAFGFEGLGRGAYQVVAVGAPGTRSSATDVDLDRDLALPEPLVVEGTGDFVIYPNPFSAAATAAHFFIPVPRYVRLSLEDPDGTVVRTLVDAHLNEGFYDLRWDGLDDDSQPAPAGEYWAVLQIADEVFADLAFLDAPVSYPDENLFAWTISGSTTDPFANTVADHSGGTPGLMHLYLWLLCNGESFGGAAFDIDGTYRLIATMPLNGFLNAGSLRQLLLVHPCEGGPLFGPILAADFYILDEAGSGNLCLVPSSVMGENFSISCDNYPNYPVGAVPNSYLGFSDDGNPPCLVTAGKELCR